jgi:Uma2 family endonuclease
VPDSPGDGQHFVFEHASWGFYERMLREVGDGPTRLTYDQGRLEVMSPPPEHERPKRAIGRLIEQVTLELNIPMASFGSTTFRRRDRHKGVEPDECYYIQHEARMRRRKQLNLKRDPPPDLVVEIDITSPSVPREPIYAALGVPAIWRSDGRQIECLHLVDGVYVARKRSLSLPFMEPAQLQRFVDLMVRRGETAALQAFVKWMRKQGWSGQASNP